MKPIYENIQPNIGSSFYSHYVSPGCCEPYWHIHPEYELVYIDSGSAERHVGSSFSRYENGDLLLIGSNIPHSNLGNHEKPDNCEIVIQMSKDFVEQRISPFAEFQQINELFKKSNQGISFGANVKNKVELKIKRLHKLKAFEKLICLIEILQDLAQAEDYKILNAKSASVEIKSNDYSRINKINEFVAINYNRPIKIKEIAELTGLTETSFSRFFRKVTGKTFVCFLNEYRVQKACNLLTQKECNIAEIMGICGFVEPAHFSRIFKSYTKYSPRTYRKRILEGRW